MHWGFDPRDDVLEMSVDWRAKRKNFKIETSFFVCEYLVDDEGFGEPWIAFDNVTDFLVVSRIRSLNTTRRFQHYLADPFRSWHIFDRAVFRNSLSLDRRKFVLNELADLIEAAKFQLMFRFVLPVAG